MVLKDYPQLKEQLYRCSKCGYCRDTVSDELGFYHVCPVYKNLRMEHYSGRGRTTIALGLSEGKIRFHKPLSEFLYTCLSCGACKEICPEKIDVCGITRNLREEAFQRKLQPQKIQRLQTALKKTHNLFSEEKPRSKWAEDLNLPQEGETLYFAGCSASYSYPKTARACVKILQQTGKKRGLLRRKRMVLWSPGVLERQQKTLHANSRTQLARCKSDGSQGSGLWLCSVL